jgi:hypothetical protein
MVLPSPATAPTRWCRSNASKSLPGPCFHVGVVDLGDDGAMVRELPVRGGRRPTGDDTTVSASLGECIARALSATIPRVADPSQ